MYCSKCGAVVVGKYCSCCGTRYRSQLGELRLAERRAQKEFVRAKTYTPNGRLLGLTNLHLATACWIASFEKYSTGGCRYKEGDSIPADAFDSLTTVRAKAEQLFEYLINF
jgi:hypothetical protein